MNSDRPSPEPPISLEVPPQNPVPTHVAIIMDGNGRWARKRLLNRIHGHEQGAATVREIVTASREIGIRFLTLYAFSTENWQRTTVEVSALMRLLKKFLIQEQDLMMKHGIRLRAIGQTDRLPEDVRRELDRAMELTAKNSDMVLTLALSYGARAELTRMVRKIASDVQDGKLDIDSITETCIAKYLYTREIPDPDLVIRTSGEMRISNFLLWQIAYAELHITQTLWPDFQRDEFLRIIRAYQYRDRRFGKA